MKFLFDNNLAHSLVASLEMEYPELSTCAPTWHGESR